MGPTNISSPAALPVDGLVPLDAILCTEELTRRPSRPPDYATESRVLAALAQALADSPRTILQKLAGTILEVLDADSAGISLVSEDGARLTWPATAGAWTPPVGGGTRRDFGPCGDVLDRDTPLLFSEPERRYAYLLGVMPHVEEALLIPFHVRGRAVGTIGAVAHDERRRFDAEDLRQLLSLGRFAAVAHQAMEPQNTRHSRRAARNLMQDAIQAQRTAERLNQELRNEIAERKQAEDALRESQVRLEAELTDITLLQGLSAAMTGEANVEALYEEIVGAAATVMRSQYASLQMLHPERGTPGSGGELHLLAHRGFDPQAASFWARVRADSKSTCAEALRTRQRAIAADVEQCEYMAGSGDLATYRQSGIRAVQTTPLFSRSGALVGMISTHWSQTHQPTERDLRLLDIVARQAADLIERKKSDEALRGSEERFRMLAEHMSQFAWTADAHGWIYWYNQRWYDYTGTTLEDMQGWGWTTVHHPDHVDRVVERIQRSWNTGELWEDTFPLRAKDGEYRWFLSRAVPIRDDAGTIIRWFGTNTDVTQQRLAEDALRESERQTREHAEALADLHRRKDEFLAMLSHELRNPLAPIANAVQLLRLRQNEDSLQQRARITIERQVGQMTRLVDDLLEVSRFTSGRVRLQEERLALGDVVERAAETSHPLITQHRHVLDVSVPTEPIWLNGDAARLEQVMVNLLSNAAKYTVDGGHIWVSALQEGDEAVLRVRDSGVGIDPDLLPRVFDLFTQAERSLERSAGGLGIGLSLVQRLVEMHRGRVEAHSTFGAGSEFVVRLPVAPIPVRPPLPSTEKERPAGSSLRVLVVDDNVDSTKMLAMLLQASGHDVRTAHDGATAIDAALDYHPDVMLLDIGLPRMDGFEVAARLRQQPGLGSLVLVAMTGYGQESDRRRSQQVGFDHHLVKPVDFDTVLGILATVNRSG